MLQPVSRQLPCRSCALSDAFSVGQTADCSGDQNGFFMHNHVNFSFNLEIEQFLKIMHSHAIIGHSAARYDVAMRFPVRAMLREGRCLYHKWRHWPSAHQVRKVRRWMISQPPLRPLWR
jgi:hypothetical protein